MGILNNKQQHISKEEFKISLKASWRGLMALVLFFVVIALGVRWLTGESGAKNSTNFENQVVVNDSLILHIASRYRLSSQHVRSMAVMHRQWIAKSDRFNSSIDSINYLIEKSKLINDASALTSLKYRALELDILKCEASYSFYSSMQMGLSRAHAIEIILLFNDNNQITP